MDYNMHEKHQLSPQLMTLARKELNETQANRTASLSKLRQLIKEETNLRTRTDTEFLVKFLRPKKFQPEDAFKLLKNYYRTRVKYPNIFKNLTPFHLKKAYDCNLVAMLPKRDLEGRRIAIIKFGAWNPSIFSADDLVRTIFAMGEQTLLDTETQIRGVSIVFDMRETGINHLRYFPPSYIKMMVHMIQDAFPARFKSFHIVSQSAVFDLMFAIARPFVRHKFFNRIHFHGNSMKSLHEHIPPEHLPEEYDGLCGPMDSSIFCEEMYKNNDMFVEYQRYGYLVNDG